MTTKKKRMKIFEVTKKEVMALIDGLDETGDQEILNRIFNTGNRAKIKELLDKVEQTLTGNLTARQREAFINIFEREANSAPFASIQEYFKLLPKSKFGAEQFKRTDKGTLVSLVPVAMANNEVFKSTLGPIVDWAQGTASGSGKSELFFMIYGKDAKKLDSEEGADVLVDGWKLEVKGSGGNIKPGKENAKGQNVNIVDNLNAELKSRGAKLGIEPSKTLSGSLDKGWFPEIFQAIESKEGKAASLKEFTNYVSKLYRMTPAEASKMAKSVYPLLGTPDANRVWSSFVLNDAKSKNGWNSTIIVDTNGGGDFTFVNILDGNDIPNEAQFSPVLSKGNGTYAYPDGALRIGINQDYEANAQALGKYKNDVNSLVKEWDTYSKSNPLSDKVLLRVKKHIDYLGKRLSDRKTGKKLKTSGIERAIGQLKDMITAVREGKSLRVRGDPEAKARREAARAEQNKQLVAQTAAKLDQLTNRIKELAKDPYNTDRSRNSLKDTEKRIAQKRNDIKNPSVSKKTLAARGIESSVKWAENYLKDRRTKSTGNTKGKPVVAAPASAMEKRLQAQQAAAASVKDRMKTLLKSTDLNSPVKKAWEAKKSLIGGDMNKLAAFRQKIDAAVGANPNLTDQQIANLIKSTALSESDLQLARLKKLIQY